jgi:hypothetical protein
MSSSRAAVKRSKKPHISCLLTKRKTENCSFQANGEFAIHFGNDDILRGIEFYPGEAMLALLDAYETSADSPDLLSPSARMEIVPALQRAILFYLAYSCQDNVVEPYTSFFGN